VTLELQDPRVPQVLLGLPELQVHRDLRELLVLQVLRVPKGLQELLVQQALQVPQVLRDLRVLLVLKASTGLVLITLELLMSLMMLFPTMAHPTSAN
jgi:hypothetical protein